MNNFKNLLLDRDHFGESFSFTLPSKRETHNTMRGVGLSMICNVLILYFFVVKIINVDGYRDSTIIQSV